MKRLVDKLTKRTFSLLEAVVLAVYATFNNSALLSLHNLIALAILIPVMFATLFIEDFLRKRAGLQEQRGD